VQADPKDAKPKRYAEHGIAFNYPPELKITTRPDRGFVTITAETAKGTLALIQVYTVEADPKDILTEMDKSLRKQFAAIKGELVKGSDKPVKRKVAGSEREGIGLEFMLGKDVSFKIEVYAFQAPSKKKVFAVILQQSSLEAEAGPKYFAVIADSLEETKEK
jgi:hypothetical protein